MFISYSSIRTTALRSAIMNSSSKNWTALEGPVAEEAFRGESSTLDIIIKALGIPLGVAILLGNLLFIVIIVKAEKPKCLHTNLIIHLTVSDLLVGFTILLQFGLEKFYVNHAGRVIEEEDIRHGYHVMCRFWASLQLLPVYHPFLLLCALNLDRLVAVAWPATYANTRKAAAAKWLPVLVWTYSVLICLLALSAKYGPREDHINKDGCQLLTLPPLYLTLTLLNHVLPATILAVMTFLQIRRVLRIHQRKIQVTNTLTYDNLITDTAIARQDFVVTMTTFITWAPFLTSLILWYSYSDIDVIERVIKGTLLLGYLTSLRFIAFILGSTYYKESFLSLFHCRPQSQHSYGNRRSRPGSCGTM